MSWNFHLPVEIIFGNGCLRQLKSAADAFGPVRMLVTDPVMLKLPACRALLDELPECEIFSSVQPNPTVANVDALATRLRQCRADVVIALGGGSAMDCAKAACALARTEDASIRPYHSAGRLFSAPGIPLIAVPTTAGTGAEVTPIAVLDDEEKGFKGPCASAFFHPAVALVDPELTWSLPAFATASTGLDALSHAIEGYWSRRHQPICDTLALEAAAGIFANLERVLLQPGDAAAREAMSYAALLAGIAFQMPKNAIMHACSFPLSNRFHLAHGAACAFTMEEAIRLNAPHMEGRMEAFARHCGFADCTGMIAAIRHLKRLGGLPCTLREAGIPDDAVELLIQESFHPLLRNNPKVVTVDDLRAIYAGLRG